MTLPGRSPEAPSSDGVESTAGHEVEHGPDLRRGGQRRALGWALGVNAVLLVTELVGGFVFGSLALFADAAHLVSDVAGLGIALGALALTARPVSPRHSFGFARAEVLAAQISALLLLAVGGWILFEGVARVRDPAPVEGAGLAVVATVGLIINVGSALLVHRAEGESLNMRASFVHLATDAVGSLGAIMAGLLILGWGWLRADSVVSMATAVLVLWAGWTLVRDTTHVLMEGTPRGMDAETVRMAMLELDDVTDVHHLHLWNLASDVPALSAHVVLRGEPTLRGSQRTADRLRAVLGDRFALTHITLELECAPVAVAAPGSSGGNPATTTLVAR